MAPICGLYKLQQYRVERYDTDHRILQDAVNNLEKKLFCFIQNPVFPNNVHITGNLTVDGIATFNGSEVHNGNEVHNGQVTFNGKVIFDGDVEQVAQVAQSFKVGDCQNDLFRTRAQVEQYWTNQAPNCQDIYFDKKTAVGDLRWQRDVQFDNLASSGVMTFNEILDDDGSGNTENLKQYQLGNFQSQWQVINNNRVQFQEQYNSIYQKQWEANEVGQFYQRQEQYNSNSGSPSQDQWQIQLNNGQWQYQRQYTVNNVTNIPSYVFQKQLQNDLLTILEIDQVSGGFTSNIQRQTQLNNGVVQTSILKLTGGNGAYSFQEVLDTTKAQFIESWTYLGNKSFNIEYDSSLASDQASINASNSDIKIYTTLSGNIKLSSVGYIQTDATLVRPLLDATTDLGTNVGPFRYNNLYLAGTANIGTLNVSGSVSSNLYPGIDSNFDLGLDGTNRWRNIYISTLVRVGAPAGTHIDIGPRTISGFNQSLQITTAAGLSIDLIPNGDAVGGVVGPVTTNRHDLGTAGTRWRNLYMAGTADVAGLTSTGAVDFSGATSFKQIFTAALVEPTLTDGESRLWRDTTNNKTYLIARYIGTQYKVELT